jgi:hypothetical protein
MRESKYYQLLREEFITQGIAQGARDATIKSILTLLKVNYLILKGEACAKRMPSVHSTS